MFATPDPVWPVIVLAVILVGDALISVRPPKFIADCLDGVGFPRQWWWVLVWVKTLASAGLIVGIWQPGVGVTATAGVIGYFVAATVAHLRARSLGSAFWVNCLGMLVLSLAVLGYSFAW